MQTTHPKGTLHPGVIAVNASMFLGGVMFAVAMFGNWLEGPRLAAGLLLLVGLGIAAEGVLRRVGWLAETEKRKQLGVGWMLFAGVGMSLVGLLMLFGY